MHHVEIKLPPLRSGAETLLVLRDQPHFDHVRESVQSGFAVGPAYAGTLRTTQPAHQSAEKGCSDLPC